MAEQRQEPRPMPETERREEAVGTVTPMMRGGYVPAWYSRISWGAIFAGVFVAIAAELILSAVGILIGFSTATVTSVSALAGATTGVGIWTAFSALVATFIGGYVASRLAAVQFSSDGLWHGLTVWALTLVLAIVLGSLGISGLLGIASNVVATLRGIIPSGVAVTPADLKAAASLASRSAGYFLLGSLLSLGSALLGGWLGSRRLSRAEAMRAEAARTRMAA